MTTRPLVSILTGTIPSRLDLMLETVAHLADQSYPNLEHCVAVEGEPTDVEDTVRQIEQAASRSHVPTRVVGLGRWWSRFLAASCSTAPFLVAQLMARGPLQMWAADDERFDPDHVERLVDLLESTDSDFVYGYVRLVPAPGIPMLAHVIGSDPPRLGQVTHALYRAELLDYRMFTFGVGSATDWDQIGAWVQAGARWAMLDDVTMVHRLDKLGEGDNFRAERQPLRGHRERVSA